MWCTVLQLRRICCGEKLRGKAHHKQVHNAAQRRPTPSYAPSSPQSLPIDRWISNCTGEQSITNAVRNHPVRSIVPAYPPLTVHGSRLHVPPPVPRQPSAVHRCRCTEILVHASGMRVLVAAIVVEDAACDDAEVLGEVQRGGDDE
jgi:hypothetical protein